MEVSERFGKLAEHIATLDLPRSFKEEVLSYLRYFKQQSQLSIEHRDHPRDLKARWVNLITHTHGLKLFQAFQEDEHFWRVIKCFVHAEDPTTLLQPKKEKPHKAPEDPFERFTVEEIFNHLSQLLEARAPVTPEEYKALKLGLWYLASEASKGMPNRNMARVKRVWDEIEPILNKAGFLKEIKSGAASDRINFFLHRSWVAKDRPLGS